MTIVKQREYLRDLAKNVKVRAKAPEQKARIDVFCKINTLQPASPPFVALMHRQALSCMFN